MAKPKKRRSGGVTAGIGGAFGAIDEVFHPSAYEAQLIREEQAEASAPMPSPEDTPFPGGRIRLRIPDE
ncbi:MAG TPA: hypothetical protein VHX87_04120 [Galbitalea sp.]|jgi:hypothetical protein|nr:hypothetical protein [Galbitalea sp.]